MSECRECSYWRSNQDAERIGSGMSHKEGEEVPPLFGVCFAPMTPIVRSSLSPWCGWRNNTLQEKEKQDRQRAEWEDSVVKDSDTLAGILAAVEKIAGKE